MVFRDAAQRGQIAVVLRVVNRGGQLVISLLLLRLVREAVGVKQLHQLPPELAHLGGFPGGEFLLLRQRRRRLRIFLLMLRARLPVFLRDLPGLFLALPHQRFQILPAIADDQPQPVAPLEMLAQPGKQPGLHRLHFRLFDREARFQFRQPRPRRVHQRPQPLQLRVHVKHQAPARDGHGSRVTRALPGDEQ